MVIQRKIVSEYVIELRTSSAGHTTRMMNRRLLLTLLFVTTIILLVEGFGTYKTENATKKTIELQTAYVYRKDESKRPHYSVIVGSSGKSVLGPAVLSGVNDRIHRVQGFLLKSNSIETGSPSKFAAAALLAHNKFRKLHDSPPLVWSDTLAAQATKIARGLIRTFSEESRRSELPDDENSELVGENVEKLFGVKYGCDSSAAAEATKNWYGEGQNFSYSYPHVQEQTSSFTQLIWVKTNRMGMGCALRSGLLSNDVIVVALYSPPGNSEGSITRNVLAPGQVKTTGDVYSNIFRRNGIKKPGS